jgi:hypothetical protein
LLWWTLAIFVILRWFHLFSSNEDDRALHSPNAADGATSANSKQVPSGTVTRQFT